MRFFIVGIFVLISLRASSQDKAFPAECYQFITEDSIAIFFNNRYHLTEKACLQNVRIVRLNKEGKFDGYFEDLTLQDQLFGKGHYKNGEKDGFFEIYYSSGGLRLKGKYAKDKPSDQWEYFYENGTLERRISFTTTDTLLMDYADSSGTVLVKYGNGKFKGSVNALVGASEHYIIAEGLVVNGKPHGNWVGMAGDYWLFCNEEFDLGKYLGGTSPGSKRKKNEHFKHLTKFVLKDYFQMLDNFYVEKCSDSSRYNYKPRRSVESNRIRQQKFDASRFRSYLSEAVKRSINQDIRINSQSYGNGDYYVTIRFSVNKEGKAEKHDLISSWGSQIFFEVKNCLSTHAAFPGSQKETYFHMKFTFSGNAMYTYRYAFSGSPTNQL
jgi:hypothetical protein